MLVLDSLTSSLASPYQLARSYQLVIPTKVTLSCSYNYTIKKYWSLSQINQTGSLLSSIELASSIVNLSELTINANTLAYGYYLASHTFTYSIYNLSNHVIEEHTSAATAFIQIVPTGLVLRALSSGVQGMTMGTAQSLSLEPKKYSYDPDGLVSPSTLTFSFFYRVVENGTTGNYSGLNASSQNAHSSN